MVTSKQAKEAIWDNEAHFRQIAEAVDHVFTISDVKTRTVLYVSPAYETVFRRSCRSLYKDRHSWIENIHPDDKARVAESFARGAEAGVYVEEEYRIVHDDGSTAWIRDRAFPIRNGESAVSRIVGLAEDITGRRSAEEALRESELRFRQLTDHLAEASWLTDWTTREILYVSPAYKHIWGRTCASLRASPRSWADSIHADDRARVVEAFERDAARGLYDVEYRIARPDGETRWIHDRAFPIRDSSETVYRMAGISEDITMRKRADEALKEMNIALANAMPGIARLDLGGRYVEVNDIYADMVGFRADEIIGSDWKQTVHPEDHAVALQAYERMLLEGKGEFEARGVRKDATTFFKHVLMVKMTDKQGAPTGHHCFMRDITERRQAEGALRESERRLRSVLDGLFEVPVGLCFLDRELRYVFINEWLAKLNGTSVEGHLGRTMREVLPDLAAGAESQLRHVLESGEPLVEGTVEAETLADPGRKHVFQHTYHPVVASDGAVVGVSCAVQDITKRERAEEALRLSDRRYRELIDALPHGIEECDLNGTITFSSPGNDRLKGYDLGEVVGQKIWDCSASEKAARELQRRVRRLVSDQSAPTTP